MTQEHPITPPAELVQQWVNNLAPKGMLSFATQAARWGADQELEAMLAELKALHLPDGYAAMLRAARRPKPPSLKEEAIDTLHLIRDHLPPDMYEKSFLIRRALESLPD
jgi:hypothetical protein